MRFKIILDFSIKFSLTWFSEKNGKIKKCTTANVKLTKQRR